LIKFDAVSVLTDLSSFYQSSTKLWISSD